MAVVLALSAALTYGLSDFVGGVASKRAGPWTLALVAQVTGAVGVLALGLLLGGEPTVGDLGWALLAGLGNGVGTAFLYRGLSGGRMGVVAPVSGVGTALLPVLVGVATGERPSALVWVGVAVALPAIWLVAREADDGEGSPDAVDRAAEAPPARGSGLVDGVLAGLGFGTLFVGLSRIPEGSGLVPLGVNQAVGAVVVLAVALALRQRPFVATPAAALGMVSGVLGTSATVAFLAATHQGLLTVSAVITALYPAGTVVLAALVLKERVHRVQGLGLALAGAAVVLVAAG